jgi:hypothetical protein
MFLGLTGGRAGRYGLVGMCLDAGDKVNKVAGQENKNGECTGIDWAYWGVIGCTVGRRGV